MAMRFVHHEVFAPMLSAVLWGGVAVVPISPVVPSAAAASRPRADVKRHRPNVIWRFFSNGGAGGTGGPGGGGAPVAAGGAPPGPVCADGTPAGGPVGTVTTERFAPLRLCFTGFAPGDQPILHVGRTGRPGRPVGRDVWAWDWTTEEAAAAMNHLGTYRFSVTAAGTATTTGLIAMRPATEPRTVFSYHYSARRDVTVTAKAVGRRPGSPIFASLYGPAQGSQLQVAADLPVVAADRYGEGVVRWTASSGVRPGNYVILVESTGDRTDDCRSGACGGFEVVR